MKSSYLKWGFGTLAVCLTVLASVAGAAMPSHALNSLALQAQANPESLAMIGFGGMIINRQNLNAMFTGFKTLFQNAFNGAQSDWDKIAMKVLSTTSAEQYAWLKTNTGFREWIGDRVIQNLSAFDYTIKNKSWENTIGVNRDDIDDDRLGIYSPMIQQLGMDAKEHPDQLVFALLLAGFASSCYDGQYFFDTDHPVQNGDATVSVSNTGGGAGEPWFLIDDTRAIKPLIFQLRKDYSFVSMDKDDDANVFNRKEYQYGVDARSNVGYGLWQLAYGSKQALTAETYKAARAAMAGMKGDNGRPLNLRPSLLVVNPANEAAAKEILVAERDAAGATNIYRNTAKLLVTGWLA